MNGLQNGKTMFRKNNQLRNLKFFLHIGIVLLASGLGGVGAKAQTSVELNTLRLGDDYSIFTLNKGGHHACQRACNRDVKCKSWTFIKGGSQSQSQCRLKHSSKSTGFSNACCVSGVKTKHVQTPDTRHDRPRRGDRRPDPKPDPLRPAPRGGRRAQLCADWSAQALNDQDRNLANGCGLRGVNWHRNYERHFSRCMGLGRTTRGQQEHRREKALKTCLVEMENDFVPHRGRSSRRSFHDARCSFYADTSVAQLNANDQLRCGYRGDLWRGVHAGFKNWCLKVPPATIETRMAERQRHVQKCIARMGEEMNNPCHDYAETAMRQVEKARSYRCAGTDGDLWHGRYRRYYRWCRRATKPQQRWAYKKRRRKIRRCRVLGHVLDLVK